MYQQIPWELVADPLGSAEHALRTAAVQNLNRTDILGVVQNCGKITTIRSPAFTTWWFKKSTRDAMRLTINSKRNAGICSILFHHVCPCKMNSMTYQASRIGEPTEHLASSFARSWRTRERRGTVTLGGKWVCGYDVETRQQRDATCIYGYDVETKQQQLSGNQNHSQDRKTSA